MGTFIFNEIRKMFSDSRLLFVLLLCFALNGVLIFRTFSLTEDDVRENIVRDYDLVSRQALENAKKGVDAGIMMYIYNTYAKRKNGSPIYNSRYMNWNLSAYFVILLSIMAAAELIEVESKNNMMSVVLSTAGWWKNIYLAKILALIVVSAGLTLMFFAEDLLAAFVTGNIKPGEYLYQIEGYFETWSNGSAISCKFFVAGLSCIAAMCFSLITFNLMKLIPNDLGCISIAAGGGLIALAALDGLPEKLSLFNIAALCKPQAILKKINVISVGSYYINYYEITICFAAALLVLLILLSLCRFKTKK